VFDRRDDYWGDKLPFKRVVFSVFDNENAMVNGLKTGQLNSALLQTSDQQAAAKSDANLTSQDTSFDFQGILIFDRGGKLNPALADARVRQALNYAIDRDALVEGIRQGRGTATAQVFGTSTKGYDASLDTYYSYDPAKAKALLAEAGYASGLTVTLPNMPTISTDNIRTALTSQMAEAGITLEWAESANPLQEIFRQFKFPGMVMNMGQSSNDWNYVQTYIQPGTFNFFGNSDPVLTEQAATLQTTTGAEYDAAATAINRRFVEQGWFVPFYRMTYALVSDKTVTVVPQDGMAVPSLYNYTPAS
jgi:peptide/nickel transport system substrate-binding protein